MLLLVCAEAEQIKNSIMLLLVPENKQMEEYDDTLCVC